MTSEHWDVLSNWLTSWLSADQAGRDRLRAQFALDHPDLVSEADRLTAAEGGLEGFLSRPALVGQAPFLAGDDPTLPAGTRLGAYEIVELLARGGMGEVYRAFDPRLGRPVALKVLPAVMMLDRRRVDRFMQEARVTAALDHPNIVRVFDVGEADGRAFLVAELLEGETLRVRLSGGALPPADARRVGLEVARGLAAAHAAGLVHRDLKPENVFVTRGGVTKLLDFGIAKLTQNDIVRNGSSTMTGVVLGTAGYLSPEQVRGSTVDARADLFALGALMWEMLTGTRAFGRDHVVETLHAVLHDPPAGNLQARGIPPDLAAVAEWLLQKDPDARPRSAGEVIDVLERPTAERLQSHRAAARTSPRRRAAIGALLFVALVLGVSVTRWTSGRRDAPPAPLTRVEPGEAALERFRLGRASARRVTPDDLRVAVAYFEEALALEPEYADAWAGLASAYKRMPVTGAELPAVAFEQTRASAERALQLDPANVEAISALGTVAFWYDWDFDRAEALLRQALSIDGDHSDSHLFLAMLYDSLGRFPEALAAIRRAQAQDQQWPQLRALEGYFLASARRYDEALAYMDRVIRDIDPSMWIIQANRAHALVTMGRVDEALVAYEHVLQLSQHPNARGMYAEALARAGRSGEAEAILASLPEGYHYRRAGILAALARDSEAVGALTAAVELHDPAVTSIGVDARWDRLRSQPDFRALARRVNLLEVSDQFRR